jgi:hypothetical protein
MPTRSNNSSVLISPVHCVCTLLSDKVVKRGQSLAKSMYLDSQITMPYNGETVIIDDAGSLSRKTTLAGSFDVMALFTKCIQKNIIEKMTRPPTDIPAITANYKPLLLTWLLMVSRL